jgi:transposase
MSPMRSTLNVWAWCMRSAGHARRELFDAQQMDPEAAQAALLQIQGIYKIEEEIRAKGLKGENKRLQRLTHSKPRVQRLFEWIDQQFARQGLLPSNPFLKALAYARDRREGLEVLLTDPEVPLDTNHVERALRTVAVGRN